MFSRNWKKKSMCYFSLVTFFISRRRQVHSKNNHHFKLFWGPTAFIFSSVCRENKQSCFYFTFDNSFCVFLFVEIFYSNEKFQWYRYLAPTHSMGMEFVHNAYSTPEWTKGYSWLTMHELPWRFSIFRTSILSTSLIALFSCFNNT